MQSTYLDVRFEAIGNETRVTVEHRGWDKIPQGHVARHGVELVLFQRRQVDHWRMLLASLNKVVRDGGDWVCGDIWRVQGAPSLRTKSAIIRGSRRDG